MNIFELRKNKLGMTLVEMVISLVVLSILMTSTMGMIISSNNIFISTSKSAIDKQVGNYAFDFIEKVLRYTTHMSIYNSQEEAANSKDTNLQSISLEVTDSATSSGVLKYKRAGESTPYYLYDNSFYGGSHENGGRTIQYSVHKVGTSKQHVKLVLTVFRNGRATYKREAIVKCLNLNLVAIGDGANPLVDKSSADGTNQFITFSVDEQLVSGGKNAFSLEYRLASYMGRYNKIQREYVSDINAAYTKYINGNYNGNPKGLKGTGETSGVYSSLPTAIFKNNVPKVSQIIFGDVNYKGNYGETNAKYNKADSIDDCKNLRMYYQEQIYDLLHFTPTAAFSNPDAAKGALQDITVAGKNKNGNNLSSINFTYKGHTGNEYYGVIATKEELYLGFLLEYYDTQEPKGVITKDEYPDFEPTFFANSGIATAINATNSDNKMVIMSYFKDNVENDQYDRLIATSDEKVYVFDGSQNLQKLDSKAALTQLSYSNDGDTIPSSADQLDPSKVYLFYSDNDYKYGSKTLTASRNVGFAGSSVTYPGDKHEDYLNNVLGANLLITYSGQQIVPGSNANRDQTKTVTANNDIAEGWKYLKVAYYKTGFVPNTRYCYSLFYLPNDPSNPDPAHSKDIAIDNGDKIQFKFSGDTGFAEAIYFKLSELTYPRYGYMSNGIEGYYNYGFKTFTAHQYTDYIIYGADWNSWFTNTPDKGILNRFIGFVAKDLIGSFLGRTGNVNIESISPTNAHQTLGNHGRFNIDKYNDELASYNEAWCVYCPKFGTWYYIPSKQNRGQAWLGGQTWASHPTWPEGLDCDMDSGFWRTSTSLASDITRRKLSTNGIFIQQEKDTNWVSLPTAG